MTGSRGFSLTEMLVSLALVSIAFVAAWQIWDDAVRLTGAAGRSLADPSFVPAAVRLRADVRAAVAAPVAPAWSASPLELQLHQGRSVIYEERQGSLYRCEQLAGAGDEVDCQRLVQPLSSWRWRTPAVGLVEVQVKLVCAPDPYRAAAAADPSFRSRPVVRIETVRAAVRLHNGGRSW